jgi:CheY-like chemotaxis protein
MSIGVALLVSNDPIAVRLLSHALQELSISADVCPELPAAEGFLTRRKFDAVIVDFQLGDQSGRILDQVRHSSSNGTAVTFAITESAQRTAFERRSAFVLERPLSAKSIRRTLKPAYGLILRERRRYFRCPVAIPVSIQRQDMQEVCCNSSNISGGGMAVSTFVPLISGESVRVKFTLPEHTRPFLAESTICWSKPGHLGIRFLSISDEHKSELQVWLSQKLEETLPEFVAGQFRKGEAALDNDLEAQTR